ncbi:MAG TPA: hypothetical protein VEI49_03790 [Terriglobales bacterium]|nr:hypothetical protein [Terriglobales bacterium]
MLTWTSGSSALEPTSELKPILVAKASPKRKHSMLPVLVVLFVISYSLMTMLIIEQGRTIDSQRALIQSLFNDSSELSHLKGQVFQKQRAAAQAQAEANAHSQAQTPSTQDKTRNHTKADSKAGKIRNPELPRSPKYDFNLEDVRRVVLSI